ncbi:hypothetical protein HKBW3S03_01328 [Candidatus Hakubella thermalkaliphila]|uniref:Uncharacterized protein n=1 Tax=Candidatus Hakubella thermalkaliphila TaxID=2754717 RepID=A0A6V8NKA3_9ACTN|nr:hypothetical protein HKBW3S03_01328 [Candidatus Hakubella thermalkaliphila]GFP40938.1 hypothetical protein HKBW3C_00063 [Candidatus Hakubella thermalkaliphila]
MAFLRFQSTVRALVKNWEKRRRYGREFFKWQKRKRPDLITEELADEKKENIGNCSISCGRNRQLRKNFKKHLFFTCIQNQIVIYHNTWSSMLYIMVAR